MITRSAGLLSSFNTIQPDTVTRYHGDHGANDFNDTPEVTIMHTATRTRTVCECDASIHLRARAEALMVLPAGYAGPDSTFSCSDSTPAFTTVNTVWTTFTVTALDETSGTTTVIVDGGVTTIIAETTVTDDPRTLTTLDGCSSFTTSSEPAIPF